MSNGWTTRLAFVVSAALLVASGSRAQELSVVAFSYLQRHGVPCQRVTQVERPVRDFDLVATCEDKRQWALFFIEGEVALVLPGSREPYRWQREIYLKYPEVYELPLSPCSCAFAKAVAAF